MFSSKDITGVMKQDWWALVKNEVIRSVVMRIKNTQGAKPHGSVLGQAFIDEMNENHDLRKFMQYLTTRTWQEIVLDLEKDLSGEVLLVFRDPEAASWFEEFQRFLIKAWNMSVKDEKPWFKKMDRKTFDTIRREWGLHLDKGNGPAALATVALEWLRDAENDRLRQAMSTTISFMSVRTWKQVLEAVGAEFGEDYSALATTKAEKFYEGFKVMVIGAMREYWDEYVSGKE
jgi:hypothetical protein